MNFEPNVVDNVAERGKSNQVTLLPAEDLYILFFYSFFYSFFYTKENTISVHKKE